MKKILGVAKRIAIFMVVAVIMATMFSVNIFAAETVKINGETFNVGDTVTYTAVFKCDKICSGITAGVTYDDSALELDKDSVNVPNLGSLMVSNLETAGVVKFIGLDVMTGFDFTKGDLLVSMTFTVKEGATDSTIKAEISDIADIDTNIITEDSYSIQEAVVEGTYPGEIITPGDGDDIIAEDQKNIESNKELDKTTIVWIVVAVLVVVAIVGTLVVKVLKNKKGENKNLLLTDEEKSVLNETEK